jgi:hypothetical protein
MVYMTMDPVHGICNAKTVLKILENPHFTNKPLPLDTHTLSRNCVLVLSLNENSFSALPIFNLAPVLHQNYNFTQFVYSESLSLFIFIF